MNNIRNEFLDWRDYYKPPFFVQKEYYDTYIYGNENGDLTIALMFDDYYWGVFSPEYVQSLLDKINGKTPTFTPKSEMKYRLDEENLCIYLNDETEHPLLIIRGYGMLTGVGGYNLSDEEANEIMLSFGRYVVEQLNPKKKLPIRIENGKPYFNLNIGMELNDETFEYFIMYLIEIGFEDDSITLRPILRALKYTCSNRINLIEEGFKRKYISMKKDEEIIKRTNSIKERIKEELKEELKDE